jgi:hypothetical protein
MEYNFGEIRKLIDSALGDDALQDLCFDHFRPVYEQFTSGQTKGDRVRRLVEYADRQREIPKLLIAIKKSNPKVYGEVEPRLALDNISSLEQSDTEISINELVERVRQSFAADIQIRCGTMRVLDMAQPIGLDDIYTDVNILEKITGRRRLEISEFV